MIYVYYHLEVKRREPIREIRERQKAISEILKMAVALYIRPNHAFLYCKPWAGANHCIWPHRLTSMVSGGQWWRRKKQRCCWGVVLLPPRHSLANPLTASRADDSVPSEMSVENALKLLGVSEGASFDDILRAKNLILASCEDDPDAVAQVETAYDMLLMQSLTQRRAGKVMSSSIRYADVKPASSPGTNAMPQWLQTTVKNAPVSVEAPSTSNLGVQAGVYGALMVLTFVNGASSSSNRLYSSADVPGLILATSFGASLYFLSKKNLSLGKATLVTVGGLVAGAVVGSAVENWLQVDIVPFMGIHSPAVIVSEFILFSQLLVSLYLK